MGGDPTLGEKFKEQRLALGLKQAEVADAIGISRSHMNNIEKGRDMPGRQTLIALATTLKLSLDFIAAAPGDLVTGSAFARNETEALVLYALRRIPSDEAETIAKLALARASSIDKETKL